MRFEKWQALGNDYVIVERDALGFELTPGAVRRLCDSHTGIGADGVLELAPNEEPGYVATLRIFNPDGSEAELSGNGAREAILYLVRSGWTDQKQFSVGTIAGEIRPTIIDERTCAIDIGRARLKSADFPSGDEAGTGELRVAGETFSFQHIQVGNPQCSIHVADPRVLDTLDLAAIGPEIEHHELFPNRTNVSFFCELGDGSIRARIFERGVGETSASGTGACGAAVTSVLRGGDSPVTVQLDGGELTVEVDEALGMTLTGWAEPVYRGEFSEEHRCAEVRRLTAVDTFVSMTQTAWGAGLATFDEASGDPLDTFFPSPDLGPGPPGIAGTAQLDADAARTLGLGELTGAAGSDPIRGTRTDVVATLITDLSEPPVDSHDVYLRLHLLSHRLATPNSINLDGIFGLLPNIAWTSLGAVAIESLPVVRMRARAAGLHLDVIGVDKFPRMTDYVVPTGVRIGDADRVRLGAYLAAGTTVMHEGFVNFNAGTLGTSMVEGRISQGVVVGDGTDIGGGSSIMGTLSGGNATVISLGERCLLGANAGLGISLGDDCVVEAGLYVTAGTIVSLEGGRTVKAAELSGQDGLLLRRNSLSGAVEALPRSGDWGGLNDALHANN